MRRWLAEACAEESVAAGRTVEPVCAKAAGRLLSLGPRDGADGGPRRAPGLGLGAGLGPGAVLSVRGGPAVEVSAGRAGGWFLDEGCPSFSVKVFHPLGFPRCHAPLSSLWDTRANSGNLYSSSSTLVPEHIMTFSLLRVTVD